MTPIAQQAFRSLTINQRKVIAHIRELEEKDAQKQKEILDAKMLAFSDRLISLTHSLQSVLNFQPSMLDFPNSEVDRHKETMKGNGPVANRMRQLVLTNCFSFDLCPSDTLELMNRLFTLDLGYSSISFPHYQKCHLVFEDKELEAPGGFTKVVNDNKVVYRRNNHIQGLADEINGFSVVFHHSLENYATSVIHRVFSEADFYDRMFVYKCLVDQVIEKKKKELKVLEYHEDIVDVWKTFFRKPDISTYFQEKYSDDRYFMPVRPFAIKTYAGVSNPNEEDELVTYHVGFSKLWDFYLKCPPDRFDQYVSLEQTPSAYSGYSQIVSTKEGFVKRCAKETPSLKLEALFWKLAHVMELVEIDKKLNLVNLTREEQS